MSDNVEIRSPIKSGALNSQVAIVLAAHGSSKNPAINRPMFDLADRIRETLNDVVVTPAFLDGTPDVRQIIHDIEQNEIIVIPFMASNGYYTKVVFPKALQAPHKQVYFADAIGTSSLLPQLVHARLEKLIAGTDGENSQIVVVGHGTRKNRDSCLTTINLVKELRTLNPDSNIKFGFIDQNPPLDHVVENLTPGDVIVVPFLMGLGPHMTVDVPEAFGLGDLTNEIFENGFEFPLTKKLNDDTNIILDAPVGSYLELADLCVDIAQAACAASAEQNNNEEVLT